MTGGDRPASLAQALSERYEATVPVVRSSAADLAGVADVVAGSPAAVLVVDLDDLAHARAAIEAAGIGVDFLGRVGGGHGAVMAVVGAAAAERVEPPPGFRVLAIMPAFNEVDVIVPSISYLLEQGVEVHLLDNWSTDGTGDAVAHLTGNGVTIERFPASAQGERYRWEDILTRVEEVAAASGADWCVLHDADERRSSPWPERTLREGFHEVGRRGWTAVNHTIVEFHPVDDTYEPGTDFEAALRYWAPARIGANLTQLKAWQNGGRVDIHSSGGHEAVFDGRRVFPYNFLLKHYPVRSQRHGEQKVFNDRKPRWDPEERKRRWHRHYDHVRTGHNFLKDAATLTRYEDSFHTDLLLERLTGEGLDHKATSPARSVAVRALRALGLRDAAVAVRRWYRIARRRDIESGQR